MKFELGGPVMAKSNMQFKYTIKQIYICKLNASSCTLVVLNCNIMILWDFAVIMGLVKRYDSASFVDVLHFDAIIMFIKAPTASQAHSHPSLQRNLFK